MGLLDGQGAKSSEKIIANRKILLEKSQLKQNDEVHEVKFKETNFKIFAIDITTSTKAVFPQNSNVYQGIKEPADYIRASMSIPLFFKPKECNSLSTDKGAWEKLGYFGDIPPKVTFVDGGVLVNFPIDAFHKDLSDREKCENGQNSPFDILRPTFGAKLGIDFITKQDGEIKKIPAFNTDDLISFSKAMINTMRFSQEKDFINKNPDYRQLIKCIDVDENQSLNFDMDLATQQYLFWSGYKAAIEFIEGKEKEDGWWESYKNSRKKLAQAFCVI